MFRKTFRHPFTTKGRKEHWFKLPLPTLVKGNNNKGEHFQEKTVLDYINHRGASLKLKHTVNSGSDLVLIIDIPPNIGQDNLKLFVQGKVILVETTDQHNSPLQVSLRLGKDYKIQTEE
jgi:hypothetical protein